MRKLTSLLIEAGKEWVDDKAPRLAAALSYYTAFSLPPLLVLLIGIAGLIYGTDAVKDRMVDQIADLVGADSARLLGEAIVEAQQTTGTGGAVAIGFGALLLGATGVFGQLQDALNTIWDVEPQKTGGIWSFFRSRLLSLAAVLGAGFLLLVSLAVSAAIGALVDMASRIQALAPFLVTLDIIASLVVITLLFALIFKYLPDVDIAWSHVWVGAAITALLFVVGKFAIGIYLGASDVGSAYGAAGSLIVVLVWIYYSALLLFYGAEFTQVWAAQRIPPSDSVNTAVIEEADAQRPDTDDDEARRRRPSGVTVMGAFLVGWLAGRRPRS
jgi:membrane protein